MIWDGLKLFFEWLKQNSLAVGVWLYKHLLAVIGKKEMENEKLRLDLKKVKNEEIVEQRNSGKSDADIVRDAISEGRQRGDQ